MSKKLLIHFQSKRRRVRERKTLRDEFKQAEYKPRSKCADTDSIPEEQARILGNISERRP
jgi:hypothetical protein